MEQKTKALAPNNKDLKCLAEQLRCPNGEKGLSIGKTMNESNAGMIIESILALQLSEKNRVLELGHGSCSHLEGLMKQAKDLRYFGMEVSQTMQLESERINKVFIKKNLALFQLYDGQNIPYVHKFFSRILTVNTIYFWENPLDFLNEMYRVLKPKGIFVIAFVQKEFMKNLPFVTEQAFNLYNTSDINDLLGQTNFKLISTKDKIELVKNKTGDLVNREYTIITLTK